MMKDAQHDFFFLSFFSFLFWRAHFQTHRCGSKKKKRPKLLMASSIRHPRSSTLTRLFFSLISSNCFCPVAFVRVTQFELVL
jgi:hypothetical protein